jgi:hypothetical protein
MKTTIKSIIMSVAALFCFAVGVSAQKVSVAIVDQHYASEETHYKMLMGLLASAYVVYMVMHNKRRKEVNRFLGKEESL